MSAIQITPAPQPVTPAPAPIKRVSVDPHPDTDLEKRGGGLLPQPLADTQPAPPLTDHSIQKDPTVNPHVAKVFTATIGLNLGNNTIVPIQLSKEKRDKHQVALDTKAHILKDALERVFVEAGMHGADEWEERTDHLTWYRYDPQHRTLVYQIHGQEKEYYLSLQQIKKMQGVDAAPVLDAMVQFEKELSAVHDITFKYSEYESGSVTLFNGPLPFDKSTSALRSLADKSFEEALEGVKTRLKRQDDREKCTDVAENFDRLKVAIGKQITEARKGNHLATIVVLEKVLMKLDAMDGFAVGIAASKEAPQSYEEALKLKDEVYESVCKHLTLIEKRHEPGFLENISRSWNEWDSPKEQAAREKARKEESRAYTADVLGLCLEAQLTDENVTEMQMASKDLHLSLHAPETRISTEHYVYPYLTTGDTTKLGAFLTKLFGSLGLAAAPLAEVICEAIKEAQPLQAAPGTDEDLP